MVTAAASKSYTSEIVSKKDPIFLPTPIAFASVSTDRIIENEHRLDASAYIFKAKEIVPKVSYVKEKKPLLSLTKDAYVGNRFKRIYTDNEDDIPFFLPSDIENVYPKATKFISVKTNTDIDSLRVHKGMLLMSCSGTIGKTTIVGNKLDNQIFSHDLIRITFNNPYDLGYVYTFLNTEIGLSILQSNNYGAVIDHIEPEHLRNVPIPNAPEALKKQIHELIIASFDLRDQSNELIDQAQALLYSELKLPRLSEIKPKFFKENADFVNFSISTEQLDGRIDASYHHPEVELVEKIISQNANKVVNIGQLSDNVILAGVFKRIYVEKESGVPFLGGRDITQLFPHVEKYLSIKVHKQRISKELEVFENYILVSDRGTIGKVQIVPKHWNGWAVSQNIIKIVPKSHDIAGYLYTFLNSEYGQILIKRETYGSVVDMIDDNNIRNISIPLLKDKQIQQTINDKVLQANELRYQAYQKEQEALKIMERDVLGEE